MGDLVTTVLLFFVPEGWSRVPESLGQGVATEPLRGLTIRLEPLWPSGSIIPSNGPGAAIENSIEWEASTGRAPTIRDIFPYFDDARFDFDEISPMIEDSSIGDSMANLSPDFEHSSTSPLMLWDDTPREIIVDAYRRKWVHSSFTTHNSSVPTFAESSRMYGHASQPVDFDDLREGVPPIQADTSEAVASPAGAPSQSLHARIGVPVSNLAATEHRRAPPFAEPFPMYVHASQSVGFDDFRGQGRPLVSGFTGVSDSHFIQSGDEGATDTENVSELTEVSTHSDALVGRRRNRHLAPVEAVRSTSKARKTDGNRGISLEGRRALLTAMHENPSASEKTLLRVLVAATKENDSKKVSYFRSNLMRFMRMDLDIHEQMVLNYETLSRGNVQKFGKLMRGTQHGPRLARLGVGSLRAIDKWFRFCVDPLVRGEQLDNQQPCFLGADPDDHVMRLSLPQRKALIASFIFELDQV